MRDLTQIAATHGHTVVTLTTWRNRNATAFAQVAIMRPDRRDVTAQAKSEGPSSGGYSKPQQALERLSYAIGHPDLDAIQDTQRWAEAVAQRFDAE